MTKNNIQLQRTLVPSAELLRVGSLNLLNQHGNLHQRLDGLIAEIQRLDLDVLLLQEVLEHSEPSILAYLSEHTHLKHSHAATPKKKPNEASYGTAILSRTKFVKKDQERFHVVFTRGFSIIPASYAATRVRGRMVHLFNPHLTWGSAAEPIRMQQAEIITARADAIRHEDPEAVILMGGDFNAQQDSSTVRFLTGLQSSDRGMGTLWVDAWRMWGTDANFVTSDPQTYWGEKTGARKSGLFNLDLVPKRRIDYLMVYGWVYGKEGSPLSFSRFADELSGDEREISDHFGIVADFWVPPLGEEKPGVTTIKVASDELKFEK